MIQPSEDRVFRALEDLLSWTSRRQQALAANVANQDTPGYRAKDYSFSFKEQLDSLTMTTTSEKHMMPPEDTSKAQLYEVGTREKPNGNTVDLERELSELTKNELQYITLIQYLSQKIKTMRYAIGEGGQGATNLFTALDVNSSGLTAQRRRAEIASSNLADEQTTRTPSGGPKL